MLSLREEKREEKRLEVTMRHQHTQCAELLIKMFNDWGYLAGCGIIENGEFDGIAYPMSSRVQIDKERHFQAKIISFCWSWPSELERKRLIDTLGMNPLAIMELWSFRYPETDKWPRLRRYIPALDLWVEVDYNPITGVEHGHKEVKEF